MRMKSEELTFTTKLSMSAKASAISKILFCDVL